MIKILLSTIIVLFALGCMAEEIPVENTQEICDQIEELNQEYLLPIEEIEIEFTPNEENETVKIEQQIEWSIRFKSSHAGKDVKEGTKITLTAYTEGVPDDVIIYWEYSDDGGKTANRFATGKTCTIIASKETEHYLYRAVVECPD